MLTGQVPRVRGIAPVLVKVAHLISNRLLMATDSAASYITLVVVHGSWGLWENVS